MLATPVFSAGYIDFGFNSTKVGSAWTSSYFPVTQNISNTATTSTSYNNDGWLVKSLVPFTTFTDWDNLTGWTEEGGGGVGADTEISPVSTLHQWSSTINVRTAIYDLNWGNGGIAANNWTFLTSYYPGSLSTSTDATVYCGEYIVFDSGARFCQINPRTDGTYIDIYSNQSAGVQPKVDTSYLKVNLIGRFHIYGFYNANQDNNVIAVVDGIEVATGLKTQATFAAGYTEFGLAKRLLDVNLETYRGWTMTWNTVTPWTPLLSTVETSSTNEVFNAGSGNQWTSISYEAAIANGCDITIEVKCSSSQVGLGTASYEKLSFGSPNITNKGQYLQLRAQLSNSGNGRYTPTLQYIKLNYDVVPSPSGYIYSKKNKGHSKK